jgi:beta-mannosidase
LYQNVIISPFYNRTTGELGVFVTSDLWTPASGTANFTWYDWSGNVLNVSTPSTATVNVGALNTTRVLHVDAFDVLSSFDPANVVLHVQTSVQGQLPNSNTTQTFSHENWWSATPLSQSKLVDPGLQLSSSNSSQQFTVSATSGVASWVWLDYPAGAVVYFDSNAFWLAPGSSRTVGYTVQRDTTNGVWVQGVTVESLYNNTLP